MRHFIKTRRHIYIYVFYSLSLLNADNFVIELTDIDFSLELVNHKVLWKEGGHRTYIVPRTYAHQLSVAGWRRLLVQLNVYTGRLLRGLPDGIQPEYLTDHLGMMGVHHHELARVAKTSRSHK